MRRLRVLFLQHCQLDVVSDIVLPNTQALDILDMSSGGVVDIDCLFVGVAVFNLTQTIIQYHGNDSNRCWKDISHVVSDQIGLCCLGFFKDRCDVGWEIERKTCRSLIPSQTLLVYCCILVMVIVICNCCVFIFNLLTKSKDAMLICNLALANVFTVIPLFIFINWHVSYGTEFTFFERFLSRSMLCRIAGDILVVCTPLTTFFQMLISLQKYCGIVFRRSILSGTKPFVYFVMIAAWITSVSACTLLRVQDMDETQITTIFEGLLFYYLFKYPILPVFSVLDMIFLLVSIFAYTLIMKNIHETRLTGRKHGKDTSLSSIIRVTFIMVLSTVSVLATTCISAWLSLVTTDLSQTLVVIVLMFPLQSVFSPFLFTLTTQRFIKDCKRGLLYVRETLLLAHC